jgi:hypothetical protein
MKRRPIREILGALLLAAAIMLPTAVVAAPPWHGTIDEEGDWSVVNNPAEPMEEEQIVRPEQMWRFGADEEDILFGLIEDAIVDEHGHAYLLDTVLSTVFVVDETGEVLRQVSGEGDGPGEFRFARELVFLPDGSLGIMEMMPGKIVSVTRDGTPRPSFALEESEGGGMMNHLQHLATNRDAVVIGQVSTNFGEDGVTIHRTLSVFGPDGVQKAVVREHKETQSGSSINIGGGGEDEFSENFTLCSDGRIVIYPNPTKYELQIYRTDGQKHHIIRRQYTSIRRPDKELEDARKEADRMREQFGGQVEMEVEEMADDISGVIARPDGELWVANSQGSRDGLEQSLGWFDVYDQEGRYVRRLCIEADYDPERDNYVFFGDRLFIFKEAQKAPPRTSTMGGGGEGGGATMVMMVGGGSPDNEEEDEEEESLPYEVICYRLSY